MEEFLNTLKEYEFLFELILTATSLIISVFVVCQTKNLAKRQEKQEKEIAEQQNELQKRQIKLELFERKFKTKVALTQIFDIAQVIMIIENDSFEIDFLNGEDDILRYISKRIKEINKIEFNEVFSRTKYIFERSLYEDIYSVYDWFESVCSISEMMNIGNEIGFVKHKEQLKVFLFSNLKKIYENKNNIMKRIEQELDISRIDK